MNYSQDRQDKSNFHNGPEQDLDRKTAVNKKYVDLSRSKATDIVYLDKPVRAEIRQTVGSDPFRKIKAVSKYNAYFDGTFKGRPDSRAPGRLHGRYYIIDGRIPDLSNARAQDDNQEKLIDFVKTYTDGFCEPITKSILKIPTII